MGKASFCRKCGERIIWIEKLEGWRPYNEDLTSHFDSCKKDQYITNEPIQIGRNDFIKNR